MKYKGTGIVLAILFVALTVFTGCVTPMGMTASTTPIQGREYEVLGRGQGTDSCWSVLGIYSVGRPDIDNAIKKAVAELGGDALINVSWYEKTFYFVVVSRHTLYVSGDVVRFKTATGTGKNK